MISTLLVPLIATAVAPELPLNAASELRADGIELVLRATSTRFAALNPSDHALFLVFEDSETGAHATLVVPAGAEVEYRFAAGALDHLELEVIGVDHGTVTASGAIALAQIEEPAVDALWIKKSGDASFPFAQVGAQFRALPVDHHLLRGEFSRGGASESCSMPHVPVIMPTHHKGLDTPIKVEKYVPPV